MLYPPRSAVVDTILQCVAIIRAVVRFEKIPKRTDLVVISPNYYQMSDNPSVNMAPFITVAMHEAMVCWCLKQHMTALQISVLVGCTEQAVYKVLRLHRVYYGQVTNPFTRSRGRLHILDVEYIYALLQANLALYLDEL